GAQSLDAAGGIVFLASAQVDSRLNTAGLYVIDASTPSAPRLIANSWGGFDAWGVAVSGSLAVAAGNTYGMRVVDVSAPTSPRTAPACRSSTCGIRSCPPSSAPSIRPGRQPPSRWGTAARTWPTPPRSR